MLTSHVYFELSVPIEPRSKVCSETTYLVIPTGKIICINYISIALKNFCRYITRYNVKDSTRHIILGTQQFKPSEFGGQINLSMDNAWGIIRCIVEIIRSDNRAST
jgi:hypothetical protein